MSNFAMFPLHDANVTLMIPSKSIDSPTLRESTNRPTSSCSDCISIPLIMVVVRLLFCIDLQLGSFRSTSPLRHPFQRRNGDSLRSP